MPALRVAAWWPMLRRALPLVTAALVLLGCTGDDTEEPPVTTTTIATPPTSTLPAADRGTAFTWTTTLEVDGNGYVLTVDGTVGEGHADYTMQVDPIAGPSVGPTVGPIVGKDTGDGEVLSSTAGAAVNGLAGSGGGPLDDVDPDGFTEVIVDGDDRWYRIPWLITEASSAMGGAEWVHVSGGQPFVADIARHVLDERYDDALRRLLELIEEGDTIEAPGEPDDETPLDELLSPWIGLTGPDAADGAPAVIRGDHREGTVSWEQALTREADEAVGRMAGEVSWEPTRRRRPEPPDPASVIDLDRVAEELSRAG